MKKNIFEELRKKLIGRQNELVQSEKFTGYNVTNQQGLISRKAEQIPAGEKGYVCLTGNGEEFISKEQSIMEVMEEIRTLFRTNKKALPVCQITEEEWKLFLDIAYDYFDKYQLNSGFNMLMMTSIRYSLYSAFVEDKSGVTLQTILENFEITMLPDGVVNDMVESIRRDVYMATRKDNTVDFQEYRKVSKR